MNDLNSRFKYLRESVRINKVEIVDSEIFDAHRNAVSRSYVYRIAVKNKSIQDDLHTKQNEILLPIEEVDRCHFIE